MERTKQTTTGSPTGSNAQGDRVPVVAQRLGQCPGHDEGGQVEGSTRMEVARMGEEAFIRRTGHWRAGCTESVPVRFGRGRLDSLAIKGLAAYLIAADFDLRASLG